MQELVVNRWCDACYKEGGQRVDVVYRYRIDISAYVNRATAKRYEPRILELCENHAKLIHETANLVRTVGTALKADEAAERVSTTPSKPSPRRPPTQRTVERKASKVACPRCDVSMRRDGIVGHMVRAHRAKRIAQPTKCPDCRFRQTTRIVMIKHRVENHGYDYFAEVAATASERKRPVKAEEVRPRVVSEQARVKRLARQSERVACPRCGSTTRHDAMIKHMTDVHGARRVKQPAKCPDCESHFRMAHNMVTHRQKLHGYDYRAEVAATMP